MRIVFLSAMLLCTSPAEAYPCWMIKQAVAQYGESAVEQWARSKGWTEREIEKERRRCLTAMIVLGNLAAAAVIAACIGMFLSRNFG